MTNFKCKGKTKMKNFDETPSFYNTEEVFKKYLAKTRYYVALQDAVCKVVSFCRPKTILELGSGTGATSFRLAKENKNSSIIAVDMREEMIDVSYKTFHNENLSNINFVKSEMVDYVKNNNELAEIIVMLYSFHHIIDPYENKINFLKLCREKLPKKGRLCIAETFLPECSNPSILKSKIIECWSKRIIEGYSSTFWASLENINSESIQKAKEIASFSMENEKTAGELVIKRDNEYLISMDWLINSAKSLGYIVEIAEPCNAIGDAVVLLSNSH